MLVVTILIFGLLAFLNYRVARKAIFAPAVVFSVVWMVALIVTWLSGNLFYPITVETLAIFSCGAAAFSIGSALAFLYPQSKPRPQDNFPRWSNRLLTLLFLLALCGVPFAVWWIVNAVSGSAANFFLAASSVLVDETNQAPGQYSLFGDIIVLGSAVAVIAFFEREHGKKRAVIAILMALALNLLTASRSAVFGFLFALLCLDWLKNRRIRWRFLAVVGTALLIAATAIAIYLGKGDARPGASVTENAVPVLQGFALYESGPLVAFDRVVRNPNIVNHNWHIDRFFLQVLNKLGGHFVVPGINADYVAVGPHGLMQNVYTFYFAYLDFGYFGMMPLVCAIGFTITLFYKRAIEGGKIASLFYSMLIGGVIFSTFNESLFFGLNTLWKTIAVGLLIYSAPPAWARFNGFVKHRVASSLANS